MGGKAKGEGARSWKVKMKKILGISVKGEGEWQYVNFFFFLPRVYNSKFGVMPGCDVSGNPRLFFSIRQARVSCFSAPTLGLE